MCRHLKDDGLVFGEKRTARCFSRTKLTDWFEVEESREGYISDCVNWTFFAAKEEDEANPCQIYVMSLK